MKETMTEKFKAKYLSLKSNKKVVESKQLQYSLEASLQLFSKGFIGSAMGMLDAVETLI